MNRHTQEPLLLTDAIPAFAAELRQLLQAQDEPELAAQVPGSTISDRCRCGDDFRAMFRTKPEREGGFGFGSAAKVKGEKNRGYSEPTFPGQFLVVLELLYCFRQVI